MTNNIVGNKFDSIFERIKQETGLKSIRQLAVIIGKRQQTISAAKAKDEFSAAWAYIVAEKYGLLTEWIMTGRGPKRLEELKSNSRKHEMLNEVEEWLDEEIKRNPERKIWFEIHFLDSFKTFKEWRRKRDQQESVEDGSATRKVA